MLGLEEDDASGREKSYTTIAEVPLFIDPKQPPLKKSPFSTIQGHSFIHTVEVTMPKEAYSSIEGSLDSKLQTLRYARVTMTLSSLIDGDFFNKFIKAGNILMLSQGRRGLDNTFMLHDGVLKLELGKEDYEKTGLTGKPIRTGGKKHAKERFLIELNLRLPSMLHGKKGFQRIEWAFKNVLNQPLPWLFFDLETETGVAEGHTPLNHHNPQIRACEPNTTTHKNINTPSFSDLKITPDTPESELRDMCGEVSEWLAMVSLGSQRVSAHDDIDPYLCRYEAPEIGDSGPKPADLVTLKWRGFIPPKWITQLVITLFRETASRVRKTPTWFALSASALGRDAVEGKDRYTIMVLPAVSSDGDDIAQGDEDAKAKGARPCICWEYIGASIL
ncbi:ribonuclease P protein subunit p40 [Aspergillus undulatus]|uniref:ribonuclease P protein subunit p40 n=1 Tax=Aspergillus undulatus TaxID=1810928 RepID=UPI003CCE37B3